MKHIKGAIALLLVIFMTLSWLTACDNTASDTPTENNRPVENNQPVESNQPGGNQQTGTPEPNQTQLADIHTAASADELFQLFTAANDESNSIDFVTEEAVPSDGKDDAEITDADYGTNVQVDGYDEGDIVKTDGKYLYILGAADLKIIAADGENTKLISTTNIMNSSDQYSYEMSSALYIYNTTLAVISTAENYSGDVGAFSYTDQCHVKLYDVSDPTAPKLISDVAQDGYYRDSRMVDGKIYLVSVDYKFAPTEDTDQSYMPCLWEDNAATTLPLDRIFVCPSDQASSYSLVSVLDMSTATRLDSCAFTGDSSSIYMDASGLYLARTVYTDNRSDPYTEEQYSVVSVESFTQTELKKLIVEGDSLVLSASAYVDGTVLNQYSMDVYNGNLRIATSSNRRNYQIYTDEKYGWSNYKSGESNSGNNVFILDTGLNQLGAVTGFAPDERIYSARFLGDIAFVVTYVETDPLFAIDLSDPTAPTIMDELEVTGVSDYLHMYEDGKLFGLGVSENWTLQAEMFDVTDLENLSLEARLDLNQYNWSEALNNPRAILVDKAHNLIAFPTDNAYVVLGYDGQTLAERGNFSFDYYTDRTRGMLIGDTVYICDPQAVIAVAADSLEEVANIQFGVG